MWSRPWAIPSIFPIIGKIRPFADAAIVGTISRKLASTETNDQSATGPPWPDILGAQRGRSEEHTSELQSLMRISYAVFCLKKKIKQRHNGTRTNIRIISLK